MRKVMTLARRELAAYFGSPMAYVIAAAFLLVVAVVFLLGLRTPILKFEVDAVFRNGSQSSLQPLFDVLAHGLLIFVPLLTMRLMAEEFRAGTIETLMTAPVTDVQVVVGKFLGAFLLYAILLATTLMFFALVVIFGQPDYGVAAMGYVGMLLLGAVCVAVGLFASSLTRHQLVAGILGIAILELLTAGVYRVALQAPPEMAPAIDKFNMITYFRDFSHGVLDLRAVVFFLTVTAFFLFLSAKVLESRRWR